VAMVKRVVRGVSAAVARDAAQVALSAGTAAEAEAGLRRAIHAAFGDAPFLSYGLPVASELDMFEDVGA